jgi:hypothetical protein
MKPESMKEPADSPNVALRAALVGVDGPESTSDCGCRWKRVRDWHYLGASISGDVIVRYCPWHVWYASLTDVQKREVKEARERGLFS